MNIEVLESLGKIAGIAGISIGALVIIFNGILKKQIFPSLTRDQSYSIIRMMIIAAGLLVILGIASWIYVDGKKDQREDDSLLKSKYILGKVVNQDDNPIGNAEVEISQFPDLADRTDVNGRFAIKIRGKGKKFLDIQLRHKDYRSSTSKVKINFEDGEDEVNVETLQLMAKISTSNTSNSSSGEVDITDDRETNNGISANLMYLGDPYNCILNLTIVLGGKSFVPQGNNFRMTGLASGNQSYRVSGIISCANGFRCAANGSGSLMVVQDANYYVMWNDASCQVTLYTEEEFNDINGL